MTDTPRPAIRILLVDDSELVRRGIKTVLATQTEPPMRVVGEAGNVADAVTEAVRHRPDIVLLDIRLPDGSGLDACRQIAQKAPESRVIVLTSYSNDNFVYEAVTAGAQGYLMKEIDPIGLIQAVQDVAAGRSILDPDATSRVLRLLRGNGGGEHGADLSILSTQERRVHQQTGRRAARAEREHGEELSGERIRKASGEASGPSRGDLRAAFASVEIKTGKYRPTY
jgi:two-component system, NarL family, response regulator DevR